MKDNIKNYLYDKKYFINIYDNYIHVFNYVRMEDFMCNKIILAMSDFKLIITGDDFFITKMLHNEILIRGKLLKVEKSNE